MRYIGILALCLAFLPVSARAVDCLQGGVNTTNCTLTDGQIPIANAAGTVPVYRMRQATAGFFALTDGTQCTNPVKTQLAADLPRMQLFTCADNDNGEIDFGITMNNGYTGGDVTVTLITINANATPNSQSVELDCKAQSRGEGEAYNNTWGATGAITFANNLDQHDPDVETVTITPDGSCTGRCGLMVRCTVDATATSDTAQVSDIYYKLPMITCSTEATDE